MAIQKEFRRSLRAPRHTPALRVSCVPLCGDSRFVDLLSESARLAAPVHDLFDDVASGSTARLASRLRSRVVRRCPLIEPLEGPQRSSAVH